jgi:Domain of unknown function (DUF6946)
MAKRPFGSHSRALLASESARLFRGFPASVQLAFDCSPDKELDGAELLLGIPGHKVPLPGGSRESQTDLFALARTRGGLAAIVIEGKVAESLGERVSEWIAPKRRQGRLWRRGQLSFLCQILGLDEREAGDLPYRLLYRTASAVFEAERFCAAYAAMLVHAFGPDADDAYEDFAAFARLLGSDPVWPLVTKTTAPSRATLFVGWVYGEAQYLEA